MLRKITITSTFRHRYQHIIRQIVCLFISFPSIYHIIKAAWEHQMKVCVYFPNNIVRDILSKTVLKVKICEKYKISVCCYFFIRVFTNTSILWMNATWMNMIAFKMCFKQRSQIRKNEQFQKFSSLKRLYHTFPFHRNITFVLKFSMLPVCSVS